MSEELPQYYGWYHVEYASAITNMNLMVFQRVNRLNQL